MEGDALICVSTGVTGATVMDAVLLFPPALAVMVTVPAETPFTSPVPLTVAIPSEPEKTKVVPATTLPS